MILFNTTFCVNSAVAGDFIEFIRDTYIPLATSSELHSCLLTELRVPSERDLNGNETRSFALQMRAPSAVALEDFQADILPNIYSAMGRQWGAHVAFFESTLDVLFDPAKNE